MTNTPKGQVPSLPKALHMALDLKALDLETIAVEITRLHFENETLHAQVAALTTPAQPAAPQGGAEVNWWEADGDKYDASISPMQPSSEGTDDQWSKSEIYAAIKVNAPPCIEAVINPDVAATALRAYIKDCEAHAIVPDVGGAWHAAFLAGAASREKAPAGATQGPTVLVQREELQKLLSGQSNDDMHAMLLAFDPRFWDELGGHGPDLVGLYIQSTTTAQAAPASVLHLVHSAFAEIAMAFPKAFALHKVGIADTAVRKALAAPAAGAVAGMPPGISALMCVISSLRGTAHFSDEEGELTDELRTLRDWAMTQAAAPTPTAQQGDARLGAIEQAIRDYHYALDTRQHGGVAQDRAIISICTTLDMHWEQGKEANRRATLAQKEGNTHGN